METLIQILLLILKVICFVSYVYILAKAYSNDDKVWGIGGIFIPILGYIYAIFHWSELKAPFLVLIGCTILILLGNLL